MRINIEWKDSTTTKLDLPDDADVLVFPGEIVARRGNVKIAHITLSEVRLWWRP